MGNPSVRERLETVSALIQNSDKDLKDLLELHKKILETQLEADKSPTKGTTIDWNDRVVIDRLQQKSLEAKKPIIHFIDPSAFTLSFLSHASKEIANILAEHYIDAKDAKNLLNATDSGRIDLSRLVEATLRENIIPIRRTAEELGLHPARLLHMLSILVQPSLEEIARRVDSSFLEKWWQASCPICGRTPIMAKLRDRKRYLICTFCGAEYLSDSFLCVHCGNRDPYTLKYLSIEAQPAYQIDFCEKCKHYVKVIDEAELKEPLPKGFEDVLTLDLDLVAKKAGFERE